MCARYAVITEEDAIEMRIIIDEISKKFGSGAVKTGIVAKNDMAPLVRLVDGTAEISRGVFGFPHWEPGGNPIVNARSESAHEKKMFMKGLQRTRCVVPATGFYEFQRKGGKVIGDYYFRQPDSPMIYMAGLIERYKDTDGQMQDHFVILTQAPNECVSSVHNRMPVILQKDELTKWLRHEDYIRTVFSRQGPELLSEKAG